MTVAAEQRFTRFSETLEVYLMTDAVSRPRKIKTVFFGDALQITVIVHIFKIGLQRVMIDVRNGEFRFDARNADRFELEISHRSRRILRQRLIDADCDIVTSPYRLSLYESRVGTSFGNDVRLQ